ncbi:MAG: DUF2877 domain-containing protein [Alphaproteobacteria bacterium]|nr:DUF2877 domain-containing protein [Alphaproteobacteria bacterium]
MRSPTFESHFPVRLAGCIASRVLRGATTGRVAALFDSSFYVETAAGLICIGNAALEPGPLTLVTDAPAATKWAASGLSRDAMVRIDRQAIVAGNRHRYALTDTIEWSPAPISGALNPDRIESGIRMFRRIAAGRIPAEGLGQFLRSDFRPRCDDFVCRAAAGPVTALRHWLNSACREPDNRAMQGLRRVHPLIGLGPGLTPSGDDLIGGVMVALHSLREAAICRRLWSSVRDDAAQASNAISLSHLSAAAEGKGGAALHRTLAAIVRADAESMRDGVSGIGRMGHTSGWDAAAGAIMAFDCWLAGRLSVRN